VFNAGHGGRLIEVPPTILPLEDADASAELARAFKKRKIGVLTGAKISDVQVGPASVKLSVEVGAEKRALEVDTVLVAAGRLPNVEEIGLEEAGVQLTERGFIKADPRTFATTAPGVFAIGDVIGAPMLAHKGSREGHVLAEQIAGQRPHPVNYGNIPSATYCHPEVASIGLTEAQCKEQKLDYKVGKFPFSANGRARTSGETEGFVKVIRGAKYGEISAPTSGNATELIHELAGPGERIHGGGDRVVTTPIPRWPRPWLRPKDSMGKMIHA
jgi:dihydrolipoamide dehydrogenase